MPKKTPNETAPKERAPREGAKEIDAAAADWAARLDRGALSPEEDARLDAWLGEDARRVGAFAKARAISLYADRARALGPQFDPDRFRSPNKSPAFSPARRRLLWGGAVAAGLGGLAAAGYGLSAAAGEVYSTRRGEMRVVPLADGSVVNLNTESRIKVHYSRTRRTVHLEHGEAFFDVTRDATRPFVVRAGDTEVTALATSFSVQSLADAPVEVMVRQGVVQLDRGPGSRAVLVQANMRAVAPAAPAFTAPEPIRAAAVAPAEVERAVAWREGRIAFEGETLAEAVKAFARYSDTRIVIDDPMLAREEVTGLFQANDPVGFAQAVATSFSWHAEVAENQVTLTR